LSMSLSLVAVFIPILLMGGIVGRLFREFAVTLAVAVMVSLLISLTTTPMMCARLLAKKRPTPTHGPGRFANFGVGLFDWMLRGYSRSLAWSLRHGWLVVLVLMGTIALNVYLYIIVPKGFFPQQDTGRLVGFVRADQGISFQAMRVKLTRYINIVREDPAVENVTGFTGGGQRNAGSMFVSLKPLSERGVSVDQVLARLRVKMLREPGAQLFLQGVQDIRIGGRQANAQYQFTLQSDDLETLRRWEPRIRLALADLPELTDVNTDEQSRGQQTSLVVDRNTASRLGVDLRSVDTTLGNLFAQRQVSTIYNPLNQYRVVMEAAPQFWQSPEALKDVYVTTSAGATVPLAAFASYQATNTPLSVNHQGQFAATTVSFNLPEGVVLSDAVRAIDYAMARLGVPTAVFGRFQGTAGAFQTALASQPMLIAAALLAVYIVLGILYESLLHPLTILSTLPSAGIGALLALLVSKTEFSIIAMIGIILLIGIVKKNAIMMIDFALDAERTRGLSAHDAILEACKLRFRPIMMTTMAALLGAIPLALGRGDGAELRAPLGIAIVGGLILSQLLTLYTTPVVYLYLDRLSRWTRRLFAPRGPTQPEPVRESS
jgi:multidrug efflux pump